MLFRSHIWYCFPVTILAIGSSFCYLIHKRYQAAQLADKISPLRGQPQVDMNIDNEAIPNMADKLKASWYMNPHNIVIGALILGCFALIPEQ